MASYVALLRGVVPMNPNMRNDKLRSVFSGLGFENVRTVISSGNVLFDSDETDVPRLESKIEAAITQQLGFSSTTIIRSHKELQALVDRDPFKGIDESKGANFNVTFVKTKPGKRLKFPYRPHGKAYTLVALYGRDICSVIDLKAASTPDLMTWLEREFGRAIT